MINEIKLIEKRIALFIIIALCGIYIFAIVNEGNANKAICAYKSLDSNKKYVQSCKACLTSKQDMLKKQTIEESKQISINQIDALKEEIRTEEENIKLKEKEIKEKGYKRNVKTNYHSNIILKFYIIFYAAHFTFLIVVAILQRKNKRKEHKKC